MKRRELERQLRKLGWKLSRRGTRHDIWTRSADKLTVPRHNEINEYTAKSILKYARGD